MLEDLRSLYNLNNYHFATEKLQNVLQELQKQPLSNYLKQLITKLCDTNPNNRISVGNVWNELKPH